MARTLRLLLVGNPNAGKSTLFNRLTEGHARVGNWHGVTVGEKAGLLRLKEERAEVYDLPGIYSLDTMSMEEKITRDLLATHGEDTVLLVSECAGLMRAVGLLKSLSSRRVVLVLTKKKQFQRAGGKIDAEGLKKELGVPVIFSEGMKKNALKRAVFDAAERAERPKGFSFSGIYAPPKEGLSKADRLLTSGVCVPLFVAFLLLVFFLTFAPSMPGDSMKGAVSRFFGETLAGLAEGIPSPAVKSLVQVGILRSLGNVLCFVPQIALLYLFLILLDESGMMSRLAFVTDGFFSRLGLSGRAVFSLLMGFGCTAAAVLTTRGLDDKRMQRRVALCLPYIPCSAKLPVFLTLSAAMFPNPFLGVVGLYALGIAISLLVARLLRGERAKFLMELAPLQLPRPIFVLNALLFQLKQFIIKAGTVILAFFLCSWLLSSFDFSFHLCAVEESMLARICGGLKWLFAPAGMNDWRIAYAALSGLVAKENVAGAIFLFFGVFPYPPASAAALAVFVLTCSPCVSAIAATARELGARRALLYAAVQTGSALLLCYLTYFVWKGGIVFLLLAALPVAAFLLARSALEGIHRRRRDDPQKLHR